MNTYTLYEAAGQLRPSSRVDERFENRSTAIARDHRFDLRGPSLREQLVAGASMLRRSLGSGLPAGEPSLPTLRDYPYAG